MDDAAQLVARITAAGGKRWIASMKKRKSSGGNETGSKAVKQEKEKEFKVPIEMLLQDQVRIFDQWLSLS